MATAAAAESTAEEEAAAAAAAAPPTAASSPEEDGPERRPEEEDALMVRPEVAEVAHKRSLLSPEVEVETLHSFFFRATLASPPALFFQLEKISLFSFLFLSFRFPFLFRLICDQIFWAGKTGRREGGNVVCPSVRQYASAGAAQLRRVVCVKGKATTEQQEFGRRRHTSFFHFHSHPLSEPKRTV